jgi:hypothetical protein
MILFYSQNFHHQLKRFLTICIVSLLTASDDSDPEPAFVIIMDFHYDILGTRFFDLLAYRAKPFSL